MIKKLIESIEKNKLVFPPYGGKMKDKSASSNIEKFTKYRYIKLSIFFWGGKGKNL